MPLMPSALPHTRAYSRAAIGELWTVAIKRCWSVIYIFYNILFYIQLVNIEQLNGMA